MTYYVAIDLGKLVPDPELTLASEPDGAIVQALGSDAPRKLIEAQTRYERRKYLSELASSRLSGALLTPQRAQNLRTMFASCGRVLLKNYTEPIEFQEVASLLAEARQALKAGLLSAVYIEKMKINHKLTVLGANDAQRTTTSMLFAEVAGTRGNVSKYLLALWNDADDILSPTEIDDLRAIRPNDKPVTSPAAVDHSRRPARMHGQASFVRLMLKVAMAALLPMFIPLFLLIVIYAFNIMYNGIHAQYDQMYAPFCHIEHIKCVNTSHK